MQCPSCDFNNMPGMKRCARCQASLALDSVDVNPPRASKWGKVFPSWLTSTFNRIRFGAADAANDVLRTGQKEFGFRWTLGDYLSLLVGGLQQRLRGESAGWFWLGGWILLLFLATSLAGTELGSVCLGLLFALHAISIADIFFRRAEDWGTRVRFMGVVAIALGVIYAGTIRTIGAFATPSRFNGQTTDINPGDVVWYADNSQTEIGQLVAYNVGRVDVNLRVQNAPVVFRIEGTRFGRQVAEAGQVVAWRNKTLYVDNQQFGWQPSESMDHVAEFEFRVEAGHIFVAPEGIFPEFETGIQGVARFQRANLPNNINVGRVGLVPKDRILGRVFLRSFPWNAVRLY